MFTPGFYERCQPLPATLTQPHADPLNVDALQEFVHLGGTHRNTGSRCPGPTGGIGEGAGLQTLQAEPEAPVLPHQHLQPPAVPADEHETVSRIRIAAELPQDHGDQTVDTSTHVLRTTGHEDPSRPGEAQHGGFSASKDSRTARITWGSARPSIRRRWPPGRRIVTAASRRRRPRRRGRTISSTKPKDGAVDIPDRVRGSI